jgi:hypothetical protein
MVFQNSIGFDQHTAALIANFLQTWFFVASFISWLLIDRYWSDSLSELEEFHRADSRDGAEAADKALTDLQNMELRVFENDQALIIEVTTNSHGVKEEPKRKKMRRCFRELVREAWYRVAWRRPQPLFTGYV